MQYEKESVMVEEIYGDVLFIINFSIDFLSLYMVGKLLHIPMKAWRVILGASLGAYYGVLELVLTVGKAVSCLLTALVMLFMCFLAFGKQSLHRFALTVVLFCGVNMLIGGMMTAAFVKLGAYEQYIEIGGELHTIYGDMPIWLFAILSGVSALATWGIGRIFRGRNAVRVCDLIVRLDGKEKALRGLVDSGNLLSEPLSGTPVIFIKEAAADFLPMTLLEAMRTGMASLDYLSGMRLRFIPSKSVSGEGLVLAAVPQAVYLCIRGEWESRRALIAVDFSEGDFGGFPALVPEILL
jgi:stage II sporulation protein GA (sporulation sigma-E factor processing peptidase)